MDGVGTSSRAAAVATAVGTGILGGLGGLAVAVHLSGLELSVGGRSPAGPLAAVAATLAGHLAVTAWACGRATGQAVGSRLSGSAALLTVALVVDLGTLTNGSAAVLRTVTLLLAAGWAALAVLGPEVELRRRLAGDAAISAVAVAAVVAVVLLVRPSASAALILAGSALTTAAWLVVVALWLRAVRRRGDDPVVIWAVLLPATMASAEVFTLIGDVGNPVVASSAAALRAGGLFAASVGIAVGLGAHVAGRRAELLRAQAEARNAERELAQRGQERRHEVGNALFAIQGAAATLSRYAGRLDEETTRELADTVISGLGRLQTMTADERGAADGAAVVDVPLARVVGERAALANRRGVTTAVTGDLEVVARGDTVVVGQVVDNLLLNAVRHGGAGGSDPVEIDLAVEAGRAVLRVRDRGPGVPGDATEQVFHRGVQLDPATEGDGLGLYLSRRLLRELGGDLVVDTSVRDGACFVATLPLGVRADRSVDRV